jgi:hypothetical protein
MIRSNGEIYEAIEQIKNAAKSGNEKALNDLPGQIQNLLDTLEEDPDKLSREMLVSRVIKLESDNSYMEDQIKILTSQHDMMQDKLVDMKSDLDKFHKIFDYLVSRKEKE